MDNWIKICAFSNRIEAEEACMLLANAGILFVIRCDDMGGMRPSLAFAGGASVQVHKENVQSALEVLEFSLETESSGREKV